MKKLFILLLLFNTTFIFSQQYEKPEIVKIINNKKLNNTMEYKATYKNFKCEVKDKNDESIIYYSVQKKIDWRKK